MIEQTAAADIALNWSHLGIVERAGDASHPFVQTALWRVGMGLDASDEIAWCSGMVTLLMETIGIAPSTSIKLGPGRLVGKAAARSWLRWGREVPREDWRRGDVCVFKRGGGDQPGKDVLDALGHVAIFLELLAGGAGAAGVSGPMVRVVGGNQKNQITVADFPLAQLLDVRRAA